MAKGQDKSSDTDPKYSDKGCDPIGEGENFEIADEHAYHGHDDGDSIDDCELADGNVSLA